MLKGRLLSAPTRGINRFQNNFFLQKVRWVTAAAPTDFDEAALAAAKPFEDIPSDTIVPVLGTTWAYLPIIGRYDLKRIGKSWSVKRKLFGDVFREKFGSFNAVISSNPDDLQAMYKYEGDYPKRNELESIKAYRESRKQWYTTLGLAVLNGKEWHDLRTKVQKHLMKPKAIQAFLNPMQDVARDFVHNIHTGRDANLEVPDLLEELRKWSLESVALVSLDSRLGCFEKDLSPDSDGMKMINSLETAFESISKLESFSGRLQLWKYFPTRTWKRFENANDTFTEIAFKHINRSLEKLKTTVDEDKDLTLLQSLLMTKGMDVSSAMVMVSDMILAGIDTTSTSVGFFLYNIARNPEKQELLYQELKKILPRKEYRITPAIFNELRYLKACLKESQRLHPVAGANIRVVDHDVIFSGYRIPAGTFLIVLMQEIHKDEKYFSNPEAFVPERWLKKDANFHPFAFVPFGFGVRSCVGRRLAELEIICLATEIIRNFKVEYHHEDIDVITRFLNVPDKPLKLNFIER